MKHIVASVIFTALCNIAFAQTGNGVTKDSVLKKGFYKNFQEYLDNAPSISMAGFRVTKFIKSKTDSTIVGADFLGDYTTHHVGHIWGFCDGENVYISYSRSMVDKRYWKAQCLGRHPFINYAEKNIVAFGPPVIAAATAIASATAPVDYTVMAANEKGKIRQVDIKDIRKLLTGHPNLLAAFNKDIKGYEPSDDYTIQQEPLPGYVIDKQQEIFGIYLIKLSAAGGE